MNWTDQAILSKYICKMAMVHVRIFIQQFYKADNIAFIEVQQCVLTLKFPLVYCRSRGWKKFSLLSLLPV